MVTMPGNFLMGTPEEVIDLICDLPVEQQIDVAMYYCQASPHWMGFVTNPVSGAWIKANAKALNERANRSYPRR